MELRIEVLSDVAFRWTLDGGTVWHNELITLGVQRLGPELSVKFGRRRGGLRLLGVESPPWSTETRAFPIMVDGTVVGSLSPRPGAVCGWRASEVESSQLPPTPADKS